MGIHAIALGGGILLWTTFCAYLFWRHVWFLRNPARIIPPGDHILSPADGTVVYVKHVQPGEPVLSVKKGIQAQLEDIAPVDEDGPKILIGIFMSPFDVHQNRAPLSGTVDWIRHHPPKGRNIHMTFMHWRTVLRIPPFFAGSLHLIQNERTVTKFQGVFKGEPINCYTVQIAGGSVRGIETTVQAGSDIKCGEIFGVIRIGSQVDLVVPSRDCMMVRVKAGDKARAGETILID